MIATQDVLIQPIVTEKTVAMKDKFCFAVHNDATKEDVKKALFDFYGVKVLKVNITNLPEKFKQVQRGKQARKRAPLKKATITVEKGGTLDFNAFK
jgi:large subunit ribosomal protein L23